jgi:chromosome segregation ATPase
MSTENKFKEFWIRFRIGNNESTHQITDVSLNPLGNYKEDFHVIEIAALEQLKADIKKLTDENYEIRCQRQSWMNKIDEANYTENSALQQLKEMKAELRATNGLREMDIKQCMRMNDEIATLKKENEKLKSLFSVQLDVMEQNKNMTTEIVALKSKLEIAVEALKISALGETQFDGVEAMHAARKALKEIEG